MRLRETGERGAALLTAMVAVAVLTAVATDLAYSSRVSLQLAANARDELRASWRARGGVSLARMVLTFQQQLDDASSSGAAGLAALGGGASIPRIQIFRFVPVGTLADALFASSAPPAEGAAPPASVDAAIEDESRKVNAQLRGFAQTADRKLWQNAMALYQLLCDARWDPLFDREDSHGVRSSRQDLIVRLHDWVTEGDQSSALAAAGTSAPCGMVIAQPPFEAAYGDKNGPYDRGEDRYRTKNARMDSLDELYLVAGVGDAFMAAFRDSLTVYLPSDAKRNVNQTDRAKQVELARIIADPPLQPALQDPLFAERLSKAISDKTFGGLFSISPADFGAAVQAAGVQVNQTLLTTPNAPNAPFTDRSDTYRIRATGVAGVVESKIEAVVRIGQTTPGATAPPLPSIIHWRED
jgi:general secretion pathway protein K